MGCVLFLMISLGLVTLQSNGPKQAAVEGIFLGESKKNAHSGGGSQKSTLSGLLESYGFQECDISKGGTIGPSGF